MIYKVFYRYGKELKSVCQNDWFPESYRVTYDKHKLNYPNVEGTRLFVFDSLKNAQAFQVRMGVEKTEVWSCDGTDIKECSAIAGPACLITFWKKINKGLVVVRHDAYDNILIFNDGSTLDSTNTTPRGAHTCSIIKLIEQIS